MSRLSVAASCAIVLLAAFPTYAHARTSSMTAQQISIDEVCGRGTAASLARTIAAIQPRTTRLDAPHVTEMAQTEIHTVSACLGTMPNITPVPVFDAILSSILQLSAYASYSMVKRPNAPREKEFLLVAAQVETRLCVSPDLMQQTPQYHTTRNVLTNFSMNRARRLLTTHKSELEPFREKYVACAQRLGAAPI